MAKILVYDIEASSLTADTGTLLCVGFQWLHEKSPRVMSIGDYPDWQRDPTDDGKLTEDFRRVWMDADMLVGFYNKGYDRKFLLAKGFEHGLPIPPNTPEVDLFFVAKANFALSRKSLENISWFLELKGRKTPLDRKTWRKAAAGNKEELDKVVKHCFADIKLTVELYHRLRGLVRQHPRVEGWLPCRACGSTKLQRRGYATTILKGRRIRVMCNSCGAWENRSELHSELIKEAV